MIVYGGEPVNPQFNVTGFGGWRPFRTCYMAAAEVLSLHRLLPKFLHAAFDQQVGGDIEAFGQVDDRRERRLPEAPLQKGDIRPVVADLQGKCFLGSTFGLPRIPQNGSECHANGRSRWSGRGLVRHVPDDAFVTTIALRTIV